DAYLRSETRGDHRQLFTWTKICIRKERMNELSGLGRDEKARGLARVGRVFCLTARWPVMNQIQVSGLRHDDQLYRTFQIKREPLRPWRSGGDGRRLD